MIAIVDTGGANICSVLNAFDRIGKSYVFTTSRKDIEKASHVILPGVGAAGACIDRLKDKNLMDAIRSLKVPTLGICIGMQILFNDSKEGDVSCLSIFSETIRKFELKSLSVPHMGWNRVERKDGSFLLRDVPNGSYFYFVHSYFAPVFEYTKGVSLYGEPFTAVVEKDNFFGTQFHPEKSGDVGETVLRSFLLL